jgi:hypothetical protein
MATRQIDARTIISDGYAPFGEIQGFPDKPDQPKRERVQLTADQVKRKYFKDAAIADEIITPGTTGRYGFPAGCRTPGGALVWPEHQVQRWRDATVAELTRILNALK